MNINENKIPSGKVTFLFTDIEGSTRLSQDIPDLYPDALNKHNSILRNSVESNNGFVFKTVGDAFCCAFQNAADAVRAAYKIQRDLSDEMPLFKIRIGIHCGHAEWNGEDYMGYLTLARTSRVMSSAYGGQILISNVVYELSKDKFGSHHKDTKTLSEKKSSEQNSDANISAHSQEIRNEENKEVTKDKFGRHDKDTKAQSERESGSDSSCLSDLVVKDISFRDLGERRLKDVIKPIRLFQLLSNDLREDFPPLKTLDARPNNLPVQLTSFIGREDEIKHVKELLNSTRLLTLTGSGGAGKTRFSLQTGADMIDDFANGVWLVELAEVKDPSLIPQSFITALALNEEPKKSLEETLIDYLKDKEVLILLDNCEQIIEACAELAEKLLRSCPKLKIIATSREALNCLGEQTFRLPSMSLPDPNSNETPEQLTHYESVRLFIERALSVNPNFRVTNENAPALAGICSHLDGMPLALELAAARTKVLSLEKIYERLDDIFNFLTNGKRTVLPRQQTLRALIDWSYELLSEEEKILWSRLSVFSGGWTVEAAEEICSDKTINRNKILDLLSQLTEKSIIIFDETTDRYRILESMKQYGKEKLMDGKEIFLKHLNYFLELSEKAKPELGGVNIKIWLDKLETDHNNLQSSIENSFSIQSMEKAALIAAALGKFWEIRGHYSTGIRLIENILSKPDALSKSNKAELLFTIGILHYRQGENEHAQKYIDKSLTLFKDTGDKFGISASINYSGLISNSQGNFEQAKKLYNDSLSIRNEIGDKLGIAGSLNNLGLVAYDQGSFEQAKKFYEESLVIRKEIGDKLGIAGSLNNLGNVVYCQGDFEQAKKFYNDSLVLMREIGDKLGIALSINNLGNVAFDQGDIEQAQKFYEESLIIRKEIGDKLGIANSINNLGNIANDQGDYEQTLKYYEESLAISKEIGNKPGIASSLNNLGLAANGQGDFKLAQKFYKESLIILREIGDKLGTAVSINNLGKVAYGHGDFENALKLFSAAEKSLDSLGVILEISEQKIKDENIAKLHEQLSDDEYAKYWDEGTKLTLEKAVDLILNDKL